MSATTRPGRGDRTTTRSAMRIASGMLWVTRTIVVAARSQSRSSSRSNRSRVRASSALNGSSRRRTAGSSASARAIATRWLVPPDSSAGRAAMMRRVETDESGQRREARSPSFARPAGELERIGDVVGSRAPRQQPRLLEDEPDPRIRTVDRVAVEERGAGRRLEEPGDDPQQRGLAAAVRADQRDDPAVRDGEVDAVEDRQWRARSGSGTRTTGRRAGSRPSRRRSQSRS